MKRKRKRTQQYTQESLMVALRFFGLSLHATALRMRQISKRDALEIIVLCRDSAAQSKTGRPTITFR